MIGKARTYLLIALATSLYLPVQFTSGQVTEVVTETTGTVRSTTATAGSEVLTTTSTLTPVRVTVGASGTIVGTTPEFIITAYKTRLAHLDHFIATARASGTLTEDQASRLREKIEDIREDVVDFAESDDALTYDEALTLGKRIDNLVRDMSQYTTIAFSPFVLETSGLSQLVLMVPATETTIATPQVVTTTPGVIYSAPVAASAPVAISAAPGTTTEVTRVTIGPATQVFGAFLERRRAEIDSQLTAAISTGQIREPLASELKAELNRMARLTADSTASGDALTQDETLMLAQDLDRLASRVADAARITVLSPLTVIDPATGVRHLVMSSQESVVGSAPATTTVQFVEPAVVTTEMYVTTLEARRKELEKLIAAGTAAGRLTLQQASQLRAEIDAIAKMQTEATLPGKQLTLPVALVIARSLDIVGARISSLMNTTAVVPIVLNNRLTLLGGQLVALDEISVRRADLEAKIADNLALGVITSSQAATLRIQMDDIASAEGRFRADGYLDHNESRVLFTHFDRVGSRLDSYIAASGKRLVF